MEPMPDINDILIFFCFCSNHGLLLVGVLTLLSAPTTMTQCTFSSSANKKGPARLVQRRLEEAAVKTKAAMSHDNKKKKQSKAAAFASSRSTLPRLILPAHVTAAACQSQKTAQPTTYSSSIFGKRGRLPESDRRDIRQISVKTGKTVQTFASFSEAGKAVGFSRHIVASILRGTYKANHYKGWTFRFVEDDNTDETAETSDRGVNRKGHLFEHANEKDDHKENAIYDSDSDSEGTLQARDVDWPRKGLDSAGFALTSARRRKTYNRIEQIDVLTGETLDTFPSFVVAAEQTGINRQKIAAMVKGELDSFEGSTFKYDDDEKEDLDSKDAVLSTMQAMRSTRPVPGNQSSDKSRRFRSGRAAFRNETMVPSRNNANSGVISLKRVVRSSKVAIPVEEIDFATGILIQTYRSLTLASEQSGANRHIISNILKGKVESWRGKAWRYSSPDLVQRVDSKTGQEQSALGLHTTMGEDHIDDFEDTDDSEKRDREETNCEHFSSRFCSAIESPEVLGAGQTLKTSRRVSEDSTSIDEDLDVASETEGKRLRETTIREQSASPSCTKKNTSEILGAAQTQKKSRRTVEGSKSPYQGWDDASGASDCSVASMQRIRAVASRDSNYSEPKTASPKVIDSCIEENQLQNSIVALCQRTTPSKQAAPPNGAIPIEADQNTCDCSVGSMQRIRTVVSRESNTDDLKPSPLDLIDFVTDDYKLQGATAVVNCNPTTSSKPLRPSNGVTPIEEEENPTVIGQLYQPTESCVKTIRNVHSPNPDQRVEHREFEIRNITLATNGSLGVVVTKTRAPDDLLVLLQEKYGLAPSNMGSLQLCVGELKAGGIAHTAGIDNGDFLLYPKRFACESSHVLHAEYNLVVGAIKNERRPAIFLLAREILKSTSEFTNATSGIKALGLTEPIDQHVHPGNSSTSLDSSKKSDDQNDQAAQIEGSTEMMIPIVSIDVQKVSESSSPKSSVAVKPKKVGSDEKVVPFCNYCNGRTTIPVHHAWCPRNAQFKTSGADEIFEKIKSGVTVKCLACLREYEMGRPILKSEHVDKCPRKLKQPDKCCNPKTSFPPRSTAQNSHSNGDIFEDGSQSVCVSFDDDPVDSIFADPLQAQQPYQTLLVARKDTTLSKKTAFISDEPSTMPNSCFVRSHATKQRETLNNQSVVATGLQENPLSKETTRSHKSVIFNADSDTDLDEEHGTDIDEVLHVSWETCGNVWGASGYTENDIVLFDLHKTLHHETIFTCERYAWSPFTSYTEYRESHWMPETGFQAIVLRRDALSIRPWGFTCARHAGGACLVTSVDPLSPAEAAVSRNLDHSSKRLENTLICIPFHFADIPWSVVGKYYSTTSK